MHAKALEIAWHERTPIWSVDVSCDNRLVTAGGDKTARVWRINPQQAHAIDWLCDLRAHLTTVNVARFNRSGQAIATGADHGEIVLWELSEEPVTVSPLENDGENAPKERWNRKATLRGHVQDVLDLSWSADGHTLVSASVDNSVMIWDARQPTRPPVTLRAHSNFVQGVAIDPVGKIVASLGNDRTFRVFSRAGQAPWAQVASLTSITSDARLFQDDSKFATFFRRLAWSPDGSVVACPSGLHFPQSKRLYAVHIFARFQWSQPAVQCGGLTSPACAVRFSPVLYALRREASAETPLATPEAHSSSASQSSGDSADGGAKVRRKIGPFEGFTYRMIFAVVCIDSVLFYDTESFGRPFAKVDALHCAEQTDLCWSPDGMQVFISSVDGYVSVISFAEGELGVPLKDDQLPRWFREYSLARREQVETKVLLKANRVTAPSPARAASFARPVRKTDIMKRCKSQSPPNRVVKSSQLGISPKKLNAIPLHQNGNNSTPPNDATDKARNPEVVKVSSAAEVDVGMITHCPIMKQDEPASQDLTNDDANMPVKIEKGRDESPPKHVLSAQQTSSAKDCAKPPVVTVVVPKRRVKPVVVAPNPDLPDRLYGDPMDSSSTANDPASCSVNAKNVTPKCSPKATSLVQTVFTRALPKVESNGSLKRKQDANEPAPSENGAEVKRRKAEATTVVDLT